LKFAPPYRDGLVLAGDRSRLGLLDVRPNFNRRDVVLKPRLAIPRRPPRFAWGPAPGGSRLGLLDVRRNFNRRVVGLKPRLAIPRRSPRFAWGPAPGGSRGYSSRAFFSTI